MTRIIKTLLYMYICMLSLGNRKLTFVYDMRRVSARDEETPK